MYKKKLLKEKKNVKHLNNEKKNIFSLLHFLTSLLEINKYFLS